MSRRNTSSRKSYWGVCRKCLDRVRTEFLVGGLCRSCRRPPAK